MPDPDPRPFNSSYLQIESTFAEIPDSSQLIKWINFFLQSLGIEQTFTLRIVDYDESAKLNEAYRKKTGPTNVLSFFYEFPPEIENNYLGDLVICAPVLFAEAQEQKIPLDFHWAHIIVHGLLHLLGFDHVNDDEAFLMQAKEAELLKACGFNTEFLSTESNELLT